LAGRATVAADKAYYSREFVATLRALGVTPHVAQNTTHRRSAIDARTAAIRATRAAGAHANGSKRSSAGSRRSPSCAKHATVGAPGSAGCLSFGLAAYNLLRIRNLTWVAA
jgi:hypothetical protein